MDPSADQNRPGGNAVPKVGLGMPVFNGERHLVTCLESVVAQSLNDFELVICDNASTDRTAEICRDFAAMDARIRYFRNERNLGAHPNYNLTFKRATGHYFKWVPHDDVLHPDYLKACVECLDQRPAAVLCQSGYQYIDETGRPLGIDNSQLAGSDSSDPAARFAAVTNLVHTCYHVMGVFRRDVLADSMLLPSFHGADRALLAQLAIFGPFAHVSEPYLYVRDHPDRYTRSKTRPAERAQWHDSSLTGRLSFPTWRLYSTYCSLVRGSPASRLDKLKLSLVLVKWWGVNWNAARMTVDLLAAVTPDAVGAAQRFKQTVFSPAPGIDKIRKSQMP